MVNLTLLRGSDKVASTAAFNGDLVTFVLDTPYVIDKGQTKNFYVRSDIDGGRPTDDTIQLYLDENTDLIGIDQQYGYGATVTNTYGTANSTAITLKGGKVTLTDNGPAATQIAQNTSNVALFDYSITADRDITVKDMDLTVYAGIGGNYQSSTLYIYNRLRRMTRGKCWVRDGIVFVSAVATRGYEEAPPSTIEIAAYVPKRGAFEEGQMWELTEDLVARIKRFAGWSNYYAEKNFKREILKRRYPGYDVIILD